MKENIRKLGIWMDNSTACLTEYSTGEMKTHIIKSDFDRQEREYRISKGEFTMHNKEQHDQADYYNKLSEVAECYDEVILFGPTNAKSELFNILNEDHKFSEIDIEVIPSDKMTENQQHAFVREHFSTHPSLSAMTPIL